MPWHQICAVVQKIISLARFLSMINESFSDAFVMHDNDTFHQLFTTVCSMAIRVVEFLNGGYKIRKIFA